MNRSAIYRAIQSGDLKSYKVGRLRRITRQALENYVSKLEKGAA
ncbi:excisionase family DNA-binding protein [Thermomonas carbonis]|uniref:Excisionase family DNA-binding protein n=2 Tax=Thermomonas carbonis TaxID=1463158 RepID=A0A7G9SR94_9GAMM|nr:excisionase family DNA-binding protein [Thermomonas carbonis]QNN70369.1 excisionase family DNA-binding protein [Thermomonas carbonis]